MLGTVFATWVALHATPESSELFFIAVLLAGMVGGALWAGVVALAAGQLQC